jgi:phosphoglycolate phosphatase
MTIGPRPTALLYDWDNTLVDAWAGVTAALNVTFDAFGLPRWTDEDTRQRARLALAPSFQTMFGAEWERARDVFHGAMRDGHLRHVRPMPGAAAALEAGRPWRQGVVSNKDGPYLRAEVAHLAWTDRFDAIVGAGDAVADKPDAAPILLALARMDVTAAREVWYLGDAAIDMQAARAAGVTGVLIGDAAHDGGVARAAPDLHFLSADALAAELRTLA